MKLKLLAAAPLLAVCALTSPLAMAASTELKLNGQIVAGTCDISVTSSGAYDYGEIVNDTLVSTGMTDLGKLQETIDIICPGPMFVGMRLTDNRDGTEASMGAPNAGGLSGTKRLGLNVDPEGNNIGYWGILIKDKTVNGAAGDFLVSVDGGSNWTIQSQWLDMVPVYSFSASSGATTPASVSTASLVLEGQAFIAPRDELDLSRGFDLDGSVTAEVFYL